MVGLPPVDDQGHKGLHHGARRGPSLEGEPWSPGPPAPPQYSRATTATLGGSASGSGKAKAKALHPINVHDVHHPRRPAGTTVQLRSPESRRPEASPMQLFVLGYGHGTDNDPAAVPELQLFPPGGGLGDGLGDGLGSGLGDGLGGGLSRQRVHSHDAAGAAARARANAAALRRQPGSGRGPHVVREGKRPEPGAGGDLDTEDEARAAAGDDPSTDEHPDAFANAMRLPLRIGQVFSVMPVEVMTGAWSPRRAVYAVVVSCGLSSLTASSAAMQLLKEKRVLTDFMVVVFYLLASTMSWLFVRTARKWATLLRAFRAQERQHGASPGLRSRVILVTSILLSVALVEHGLSQVQNIMNVLQARPDASGFSEYFEIYFRGQFPMVVLVIGYWPYVSPFVMFLNFSATFLWNFTDLFIMLVGVAVASRFKLLQESISAASGNTMEQRAAGVPPTVLGRAYWQGARRSYNSLSKLVRIVDQALNVQLFVSFLNNLYFVCMQLLRGFDDPSLTWLSRVYVLFSFAFLVARTAAVSLLVSSVHENSRSVQDVLYCVCSEDYSEEVHRFLVQVTSELVAFSGLKMFKVTRGLLLTVAGTILTYEVVLVQLN